MADPTKISKGFFSTLREAIAQSKSKSMPANQWLSYLTPGREVRRGPMMFPIKKEELEWSGLGQFLKDKSGSISKEDLLESISSNPVVGFHDLSRTAVDKWNRVTKAERTAERDRWVAQATKIVPPKALDPKELWSSIQTYVRNYPEHVENMKQSWYNQGKKFNLTKDQIDEAINWKTGDETANSIFNRSAEDQGHVGWEAHRVDYDREMRRTVKERKAERERWAAQATLPIVDIEKSSRARIGKLWDEIQSVKLRDPGYWNDPHVLNSEYWKGRLARFGLTPEHLQEAINWRASIPRPDQRLPMFSSHALPGPRAGYGEELSAWPGSKQINTHWTSVDPAVFSHSRHSTRVLPDKTKMHLIEEIQSDPHQRARDVVKVGQEPWQEERVIGYRKERPTEEDLIWRNSVRPYNKELGFWAPVEAHTLWENTFPPYRTAESELRRRHLYEVMSSTSRTPPSIPLSVEDVRRAADIDYANLSKPQYVPYGDTYHELEIRRQLGKAIEEGRDWFGLTTGQQQATKWGHMQEVPQLTFIKTSDGKYSFENSDGYLKDKIKGLNSEQVRDLLGPDIGPAFLQYTRNIDQGVVKPSDLGVERLTWGGSGMRVNYDKKYPSYIKKLFKQYGGSDEVVPVTVRGEKDYRMIDPEMEELIVQIRSANPGMSTMQARTEAINKLGRQPIMGEAPGEHVVHGFRITPEMKRRYQEAGGFPLFSVPPVVAAGAAGSQMLPEEPQPYKDGGSVRSPGGWNVPQDDDDSRLFNDVWSRYSRRPDPILPQPLSIVRNRPGDVSARWSGLGDAWNRQLFETNRPKYIPGPLGGLINNAIDFMAVPQLNVHDVPSAIGSIPEALLYSSQGLIGPSLRTAQAAITPAITKAWEGGLSALRRAAAPTTGISLATQPDEAEGAPKVPKGFFSVLRDAIEGSKSRAMPPDQWSHYLTPGKRTVTREGGIFPLRQDELEFSGLNEYLKNAPAGRPIRVEDMITELDRRPLPTFVDQGEGAVARAEKTVPRYNEGLRYNIDEGQYRSSTELKEAIWKEMGVSGWDDPKWTPEMHREYSRLFNERAPSIKFSQPHLADEVPNAYYDEPDYRLPGPSSGYEENLTKWAGIEKEVPVYEILQDGKVWTNMSDRATAEKALENQKKNFPNKEWSIRESKTRVPETEEFIPFAGHFEEEPNLLSHGRATRRQTADGKNVRQIEEIQSDWHQQAREEGYGGAKDTRQPLSPEEKERLRIYINRGNDLGNADPEDLADYRQLLDREAKLYEKGIEKPPWAPYSKTYTELELKKQILKAIEDGDEYVAWTTGQQQIDRYSEALKKNVDIIGWDRGADGKYNVRPYKGESGITLDEKMSGLDEKGLRNLLGKEMADRIIANKNSRGTLAGDDLTIGGSGMRHHYDTNLPDVAKKLVKQYGGEYTEVPVRLNRMSEADYTELFGQYRKEGKTAEEAHNLAHQEMERIRESKQPAIRVTPEMREAVRKRGFPLFLRPESLVAAGATGAALSPSPDENP